jgi:hypothetical protein
VIPFRVEGISYWAYARSLEIMPQAVCRLSASTCACVANNRPARHRNWGVFAAVRAFLVLDIGFAIGKRYKSLIYELRELYETAA